MQQKYIFTLPMKVRDYEVDAEGIVNNAIYLHYFEHTRHEFCEHAGMSFAQMHAQGIDPVLNRVEIDYRTPSTSASAFSAASTSPAREPASYSSRTYTTPTDNSWCQAR